MFVTVKVEIVSDGLETLQNRQDLCRRLVALT